MSDPRAWLAEAQERAEKDQACYRCRLTKREHQSGYASSHCTFIASPHTDPDIPTMAAALTAVLNLHYPLNGPHEHLVCAHRHCIDDAGDQCRWPCMTARAITENLPKEDHRGE